MINFICFSCPLQVQSIVPLSNLPLSISLGATQLIEGSGTGVFLFFIIVLSMAPWYLIWRAVPLPLSCRKSLWASGFLSEQLLFRSVSLKAVISRAYRREVTGRQCPSATSINTKAMRCWGWSADPKLEIAAERDESSYTGMIF